MTLHERVVEKVWMHRTLTKVKHLTSSDLFAFGASEVDALDESPLIVDLLNIKNLMEIRSRQHYALALPIFINSHLLSHPSLAALGGITVPNSVDDTMLQ